MEKFAVGLPSRSSRSGFAHIVRVDGKPVELIRIDPEENAISVAIRTASPSKIGGVLTPA
ncbi:MAG: hypothetical protein KIT82_16205 [Bradyrhizobium sp.]|nr:hypothetical protein [Bradyrhizobium sp.]